MPSGTVFARGTTTDDENGINLSGSKKLLRWVAVRGDIADWAVYAHLAENDWDFIRSNGDKPHGRENVARVVPHDDEAWKMYRH